MKNQEDVELSERETNLIMNFFTSFLQHIDDEGLLQKDDIEYLASLKEERRDTFELLNASEVYSDIESLLYDIDFYTAEISKIETIISYRNDYIDKLKASYNFY